ncbi:hypothetical protein COY28_01155 [Candidatus Woesearchaeota archaeon CG_4_10_14_0_2_um_filter_57_5]|nr:MAG: hypothetical protein AUJ68_05315 [Candidatus Woesearchaeota archaeon CG1_02_57_44]PIN68311.1 MAG: hypothetical protein COV94_05365 [Candidatus Woesearchaeota archaeon CG11_big_fil_rev_8_21_14_0_20_57_5]PIZ56205.1 MAG: hypothetical protein COY28_01155 [Candidatus Woesearchaeota archaeon CG_4_10_14_0_2_um_filter_57_5]
MDRRRRMMPNAPSGRTALLMALAFTALFFATSMTWPSASAAVVKGSVFTPGMERAVAILTLNTTPMQRLVTDDGNYEFYAPQGDYLLVARSNDGTDSQMVRIDNDGVFHIDLILLPDLEDMESLPVWNLQFDEPPALPRPWAAVGLAAAILLVAIAWALRPKKLQDPEKGLPGEILSQLDKHGGRATQKELRAGLPYSEAKVSMCISELEQDGKIRKIRKGRGNIIIRT